MRTTLISFAVVILGAFVLWGCGDSTSPEPLVNRVYLPEKITAAPGDDVAMTVNFDNEVPLAAINVPLLLPSALLHYDSVSFSGSRTVNFTFHPVYVLADTLVIGAFDDTAAVPSGRGLLVTIYFQVRSNAPDTTIDVGTLNYPRLPLSFYDLSLLPVANPPQFKTCRLTIK